MDGQVVVGAVCTLERTATLVLTHSLQSALLHQQPVRARVVTLPDVSAGERSSPAAAVCQFVYRVRRFADSLAREWHLVYHILQGNNYSLPRLGRLMVEVRCPKHIFTNHV